MTKTPARLRAMSVLRSGPIDEAGLAVHRIQRRTMQALIDAGLVKFRPYGKPPSYALTEAGRAA